MPAQPPLSLLPDYNEAQWLPPLPAPFPLWHSASLQVKKQWPTNHELKPPKLGAKRPFLSRVDYLRVFCFCNNRKVSYIVLLNLDFLTGCFMSNSYNFPRIHTNRISSGTANTLSSGTQVPIPRQWLLASVYYFRTITILPGHSDKPHAGCLHLRRWCSPWATENNDTRMRPDCRKLVWVRVP
jgi:hypothetical protein